MPISWNPVRSCKWPGGFFEWAPVSGYADEIVSITLGASYPQIRPSGEVRGEAVIAAHLKCKFRPPSICATQLTKPYCGPAKLRKSPRAQQTSGRTRAWPGAQAATDTLRLRKAPAVRREAAEDDESAINLLSDSVLQSQSHSGSVVPFCGEAMMPLTMRPSGLSSGIDKDRPDYTVYWRLGSWPHLPDPRRSRQSALVLVVGPMTRSGRVATFDEAKAKLQKCWDAWKAWAERLNFFP